MKRIVALTFMLSWMGGTGLMAEPSPQASASQDTVALSPRGNVALSADAAVFVMKVTDGGTKEVEAGKLAVSRASAADVKAFARRMVDDHTKAGAELAALARAKKITTSSNPERMKTALKPMEALAGTAFDRAYMDEMVKDHEATMALFENHLASGTDTDVKAWAQNTLPTLREHLAMAKKAQAALPASRP